MSARIEALKQTKTRIESVHRLLSVGQFNIQGSGASELVGALAFMEELRGGIARDLEAAEKGEVAMVKTETKPTAPALNNVKKGNFKPKGKPGRKPGQVVPAPAKVANEAK